MVTDRIFHLAYGVTLRSTKLASEAWLGIQGQFLLHYGSIAAALSREQGSWNGRAGIFSNDNAYAQKRS